MDLNSLVCAFTGTFPKKSELTGTPLSYDPCLRLLKDRVESRLLRNFPTLRAQSPYLKANRWCFHSEDQWLWCLRIIRSVPLVVISYAHMPCDRMVPLRREAIRCLSRQRLRKPPNSW